MRLSWSNFASNLFLWVCDSWNMGFFSRPYSRFLHYKVYYKLNSCFFFLRLFIYLSLIFAKPIYVTHFQWEKVFFLKFSQRRTEKNLDTQIKLHGFLFVLYLEKIPLPQFLINLLKALWINSLTSCTIRYASVKLWWRYPQRVVSV